MSGGGGGESNISTAPKLRRQSNKQDVASGCDVRTYATQESTPYFEVKFGLGYEEKTFRYAYSESLKLSDVRNMVSASTGYSSDLLRIIVNGKSQTNDDVTLGELGVRPKQTILAIKRLIGG